MKTQLLYVLILLLVSCQSLFNSKQKFSNSGVTNVLNGKNQIDSLKFICDSCFEILQDKSVLDSLIIIATNEAKNNLRNKLSFKPVSVNFKIIRQDSVFYISGKPIDSLVAVIADYKCIGKNAYGVENEVESTSLTYLINNRIVNLDGKIRKDSLSISSSGSVSRLLTIYDDKDNGIIIQPIKIKDAIHLIVKTEKSCVENSRLIISFQDDSEITVKSWNKFNCNSTSYFEINLSNIEQLGTKKLKYISFYDDELVFCSVPENEKDYFNQFVNLIIGIKEDSGK